MGRRIIASLLSFVEDNLGHVAGPQLAGFALFNVGLVLLAVALWKSAAVPRWLPAALGALTAAQFATPATRALDIVQAAHLTTFIAIAWFVRQAATDR